MIGILIFAAIVLAFAIVVLIARSSELIGSLKGKDNQEKSSKTQAVLSIIFLVGGLILLVWSVYVFKGRFLPAPASMHGKYIDESFKLTLLFTGIVFLLTQILLFYFTFKYRFRKNAKAFFYPENTKLELAWTIIPSIVLTVLVINGVSHWYKIFKPAPENAMIIEATGKQFEWIIRYPGEDGVLGRRNPVDSISANNILGIDWSDPASRDDIIASDIHLMVNNPVLIRIRALDVLHSFYLPHFRVKMDAVPGTPTRFWFIPVKTTKQMRQELDNPDFNYELACAELCGAGHSSMRKLVVVDSELDYLDWITSQTSYYDLTHKKKIAQTTP